MEQKDENTSNEPAADSLESPAAAAPVNTNPAADNLEGVAPELRSASGGQK
jgi:hypothetical protein